MQVLGSDGKKVLWGVVDDNFVEDPKENDEIGLRIFYFGFLMNMGW